MVSGWRSESQGVQIPEREGATLTPLATFDPGLPQNAQKK